MNRHAKAPSGFTFGRKVALGLVLVAMSLLVLAPAAFAGKIVDRILAGTTTTGTAQGLLSSPAGIAVNDPTVADASTDPLGASTNGYVYVADDNNHRIQVFDAAGNFKFMWGRGVQSGGDGAQICDSSEIPCQGGTLDDEAGEFDNPRGVAINQANGHVYVRERDNRRVQEFEADGDFVRAWGWDVVAGAATPGQADEQQAVTVNATSGTYTLTFSGQTTTAIPFDAPASGAGSLQEALDNLSNLDPGDVLVGGGPGGAGGTNPYVVQFAGAKANANQALMTSDAAGLSGGSATISTRVDGAISFEVCIAVNGDVCKIGTSGANAGQFGTITGATGIAVDPAAPHHVFAVDPGNRRVQEFQADGTFVRLWGWDVVNTGQPGNVGIDNFEICASMVLGVCKSAADTGLSSPGDGAFRSSSPAYIAIDGVTGVVYASNGFVNPNRVERFDSDETTPLSMLKPSIGTSFAGASAPLAVDPFSGNLLLGQSSPIQELDTSVEPPATVTFHIENSGLSPTGMALNPATGDLFFSSTTGGHRVFVADNGGAPPASVAINPPIGVGAHQASFSGSITPGSGFGASYRFQYSRNGITWTDANSKTSLAPGTSPVAVGPITVTGLEANTLYRVRAVTAKDFGNPEVLSPELTFLTDAPPPEVETLYPQARTATSAVFAGLLNPNNLATSYHFEYGKTTSYGSVAPVPAGSASGGVTEKVLTEVEDLAPDTTYHVRLVATNAEGTASGQDVTFTTRPAGGALPPRAYEMVTPPFKLIRTVGITPAMPSLDGDTVLWATSFFPLTDDVRAPGSGDRRIIRRTAGGWANETLNSRQLVVKVNSLASPLASRQVVGASSGDLETVSWLVDSGIDAELLPSAGIKNANRIYTRRTGTGTDGFTAWLNDADLQASLGLEEDSPSEHTLYNDDGSAMVRWGFYRDLADLSGTSADEDPSDDQQLTGPAGGATIYSLRADAPQEVPSAPRDLVNECTGTIAGGDATELPARVGSGAPTDTIGIQSCEQSAGGIAGASGAGDLSSGSATVTNLTTASGAFAPGQLIQGLGIPEGTRIASVGPGTLTLSANAAPKASLVGTLATGAPTVTGLFLLSGTPKVGQAVSGTGIPAGATIIAYDGATLTLSANATASGSQVLSMDAPQPGAALSADFQHVTSLRGAEVGGVRGPNENQDLDTTPNPMAGPSSTAMSGDGRRIFFQSPDHSSSAAPASCAAGTGASTDCPPQLFVRQYASDGTPVVRWISRPQGIGAQRIAELGAGANFQGASRDGRYVFFKTNAPLIPGDPNGGLSITDAQASNNSWDLYRYELPADLDSDPASGTLTRISGGPTGTADPSTTVSGPIPGVGSSKAGTGAPLRFHSDDGKRAYFVTTAPIPGAINTAPTGGTTTPGGSVGNSETRNLYLFDDSGASPVWEFVAQIPFNFNIGSGSLTASALDACASSQWGVGYDMRNPSSLDQAGNLAPALANCFRGTPDARQVIFSTSGQLTGDDTDTASDIYLYDSEKRELVRVTAPPPEAVPYSCNSKQGGVVFPGICNGDLGSNILGNDFTPTAVAGHGEEARGWAGMRYYNVFREGDSSVTVLFQSKSELVEEDTNGNHLDVYQWHGGDLSLISPGNSADDSYFTGSSVDGQDVFFLTSKRIDPREIDNSDYDIYNARVGGGFPYVPPPAPCDVLAHACRSSALPTPEPRGAASRGFSGTGNIVATRPKPRTCKKGRVRRNGKCTKRRGKKAGRTTSKNRRTAR